MSTAKRRLSWTEVEQLAASVRALLADPHAGLTEHERRRWEGALVALEVVLGERENDLL